MSNVIDLSDFQGDDCGRPLIDFSQSPVDLAGCIVKVSEGCSLQQMYPAFIQMAHQYHIPLGAYCYTHARTTDRAREEAQTLIGALQTQGITSLPLGIFIDIEDPGVLAMDKDDITACASAFIVQCNQMGYNNAGIYASSGRLLSGYCGSRVGWIDVSQLADYVPYWVAQYGGEFTWTQENPSKTCAGHQYTESFDFGGTQVDMSEWFGQI
jgi:hypothetical protein